MSFSERLNKLSEEPENEEHIVNGYPNNIGDDIGNNDMTFNNPYQDNYQNTQDCQNNSYTPNQYNNYGQQPINQYPQQSVNQYPQNNSYNNEDFSRGQTFRPIRATQNKKCSTKNRIIAFLLDGLLSNIPAILITTVWLYPAINEFIQVTNYVGSDSISTNIGFLVSNGITISIISLFFYVLYFVIIPFYVLNGRTFGKKMMKLKVVLQDDDEDMKIITLIKREILGKMICGIILVGYFMGLGKSQLALHDKIAKTKVIDDDEIVVNE